jgi:eukaryotic-like serine/threonine-protein kinase
MLHVMTDAPVHPGDILAGKYRVDRVLGKGNMGVVVAATHVDLGQRVALKFMLSGQGQSREHRERFLREARAAVRLRSQHVARVIDVGTLENDAPYIVMEFLEGGDLAAVLKEQGPLSFADAVEYVLQTCEAAGEAHAAGIVHRDLKPANLFLTVDVGGAPCIKVLDFGISKVAGTELTLTDQALGSPMYMSPEQMNSSKHIDARSDVWSLGTILYKLVAGQAPYQADTVEQLCMRVLLGQPTPLAEFRSDAPPGLEAVILRCLQRDRDQRMRNVAELAAALAPYAPARARAYPERVARALGAPMQAAQAPVAQVPPMQAPIAVGAHPAGTAPSETTAPAAPRAPMASSPTGTLVMTSPAASPALHRASHPSHSGVPLGSSEGLSASQVAKPASSSIGLVLGAALALGAGGFAAYKLVGPGGSTEPSRGQAAIQREPQAASSSPSIAASTRTVRLMVEPANVTVEIDGREVPAKAGLVELSGTLGSTHPVRLRLDGRETTSDVTIAESGAVPPKLALVIAAPERSASAAAPRPQAPATSAVKANKGEMSTEFK